MSTHNGLTYENVLGRKPREISFTLEQIEHLRSQRILITGAGGSIGSRIAIALSNFGVSNFICTDRDESSLHSLSLKIDASALFDNNRYWLLDIKESQMVDRLMGDYRPTAVIHAAALKHLSVLEKQPEEALSTNILGTLNLLNSSVKYNSNYFINVSTDKAANPESVLGRSKYLTELLTSYFKYNIEKSFMSVRFGNVFASRGSVIETFAAQMSKSLPITLTSAQASRFFMHQDEAAHLTLKALVLNQGDVNIFDMGEPVRIMKIIESLQLILESESLVVESGLRKGEKLTEDLFADIEDSKFSTDPLIKVASHLNTLKSDQKLVNFALTGDKMNLLKYLKHEL